MSKLKKLDIQKMGGAAHGATELLKALANEKRLMILCQLADGEKSVGELGALLDIKQAPLSQHLARLRQDDLVQTRREAQTIFYSLKGDAVRRVIGVLYDLYCGPEAC